MCIDRLVNQKETIAIKAMGRTSHSQERLSEIYRKALDLFAKNGYDATSMSMIAEASGMSQGNLFHYCHSKENLLFSIHLDHLQKNFIPILNEAEQLADPTERIALFLRKFALLNTSSPAGRLFVHEIRSLNKNHYNEIISVWRRAYELMRDAINELQLSGKARKSRESLLTFMGVGMVFWIVYWFDYSRQSNAEEVAETVVQTFMNGLLYPVDEEGRPVPTRRKTK